MPCPRRIFWEKQAHVFFREGIAPSSGRCGNSARSASGWAEPSFPSWGAPMAMQGPRPRVGLGPEAGRNRERGGWRPTMESGRGTGWSTSRGRGLRAGTVWTRCWCRCRLRGPFSRAGPSRLASPEGVIANICAVVIEAEAHRYKFCVPCPRYWYHFSENSAFFFFLWKYSSAPLASGSNFHAITLSFPFLCQGGNHAVCFCSLLPFPTWRELSGGGLLPPAGDGFSRERGARLGSPQADLVRAREPSREHRQLVCRVGGCGDRETSFVFSLICGSLGTSASWLFLCYLICKSFMCVRTGNLKLKD